MGGHPLWPDDVEAATRRIIADVEQKLQQLGPAAKEVPLLVGDLHALVNEGRSVVKALNQKLAEVDDLFVRVRAAFVKGTES